MSTEDRLLEYYGAYASKTYYSGFLFCRMRKAKQKPGAFDRIYLELNGNTLAYWSAGHCDTDKSSIFRIKNATEPTIVTLSCCEAAFSEEERERTRQPFCFCFKVSVQKENFELKVNGLDDKWLELQFLNYVSCSKFFTAAQLSICEHRWLRCFYANLLCDSNNLSPEQLPELDSCAFLVKTPSDSNWHQFHLGIAPKSKKSSPNDFQIQIFADDSRRQLIGSIGDFSDALPNVYPTSEGMFCLTLENVHYRANPNAKLASKLLLFLPKKSWSLCCLRFKKTFPLLCRNNCQIHFLLIVKGSFWAYMNVLSTCCFCNRSKSIEHFSPSTKQNLHLRPKVPLHFLICQHFNSLCLCKFKRKPFLQLPLLEKVPSTRWIILLQMEQLPS